MGLEDFISSYKTGFNQIVGVFLGKTNDEISTDFYGYILGSSTGILTVGAAFTALGAAVSYAAYHLPN